MLFFCRRLGAKHFFRSWLIQFSSLDDQFYCFIGDFAIDKFRVHYDRTLCI